MTMTATVVLRIRNVVLFADRDLLRMRIIYCRKERDCVWYAYGEDDGMNAT